MKWRALLIAVLGIAVLANAALIVDVLGGGLLPGAEASSAKTESTAPKKVAAEPPKKGSSDEKDAAKEAESAYRVLVAELTEQKAALDKKSAELAERERQVNVIREELKAQKDQQAAASAQAPVSAKGAGATVPDAFKKLVKTYAGMEPDSAARALAELYSRDRDVAIDLMLALPARKSSAILGELATQKASLAGDLSVEMSHRDEPRAQ